MSGHTKGSWSINHSPNCHNQWSVSADDGDLNGFSRICQLEGSDDEANANLIASAPDLLSALEGLVIAYQVLDGSITHAGSRHSHAMAAIAKATGDFKS